MAKLIPWIYLSGPRDALMPSLFLELCRRLLLDEIGIHVSRLSKADFSSSCEWISSNQLKANKRFFSPFSKKEFFLTDSPGPWLWSTLGRSLKHWLSPSFYLAAFSQSLHFYFSWVSRLLLFAWIETVPLASQGLQLILQSIIFGIFWSP